MICLTIDKPAEHIVGAWIYYHYNLGFEFNIFDK